MKDPLYILDGYGLLYRAHFAFIRNPLYNPEGRNSSAIFGFFRTLFSLLQLKTPKRLVVALDSRTKTFRHELYPEYKATRDKTPEDLHEQIGVVEEILDVLNLPTIRADGFEADDIIATLAKECSSRNETCFIISGDKDLLQLVDEQVRVLYPSKGEYREIGPSEVPLDWGVEASQIVDYLSLVGDQSDNIPGVKGIGPKSAVSLLSKYGTLDEIFEHLDDITGAQKTKLEDGKESAFMSRTLIILNTDVPINVGEAEYSIDNLNRQAAIPYFLKEGIKSIAEELGSESNAPAQETGTVQKMGVYTPVLTVEELDRWVALVRKNTFFAFDSETDSLDAMQASPVGFSLSVGAGEGCYIPVKARNQVCLAEEVVKERLESILTDPSLKLIGQNIKYDYKVLKRWGIRISNIAFDTMIAAWLLNSQAGSYSMDNLAEKYLEGYTTIHFNDVVEKGKTFDTAAFSEAVNYAAEDADITFRLFEVFQNQIQERGFGELLYSLELPLIPILAEMEMAGIKISRNVLEEYSKELAKTLAEIEDEIFTLCGEVFNVNSTKQLQTILFEKRKLRAVKKTKTGYSTDMSVLEELSREDPVPALVLRHRILSKLKSTYVDTLPLLINETTGRIHSNFVQTGTATGRLSSRDPNLQNIPVKTDEGRRIRQAFHADTGNVFVSADYSQIELVVLAHLSGDPALIDAFSTGEDVHRRTGALIFGVSPEEVSAEQRRIAKTINFGVMYGMSAFRLSRELNIPRGQADQFISSYFNTYSAVKQFIDRTIVEAEKKGCVTTIAGRERAVPRIASSNRTEKMAAERIAVNTPIQGSAADIVKRAMLKIARRLEDSGLEAKLLLQVHDELIFEAAEKDADELINILNEEMESAVQLSIPLRVSIEKGKSWGELH